MQKRTLGATVAQAVQSTKESEVLEPLVREKPIDFTNMLSTGSTLLDLSLTGGVTKYGGCPGGIFIEIYGKSGSGKTSILSELGASAQAKGGDGRFIDPEARLNKVYMETYGLKILPHQYFKPDTVNEMFKLLEDWNPPENKINIFSADSLAALSTELEMDSADKMGMKRAKDFSANFRKYCRLIEKKNWLMAASNQVRQGEHGDTTPGGRAAEFYASARISVNRVEIIEKEKKLTGMSKAQKRATGIISLCKVVKSSLDRPFRQCPIYIMFDYGLDDIRANLQYLKDTLELTKYWVGDARDGYQQLDMAVKYIEDNDLQLMLKDRVVEVWNQVEALFNQPRKMKKR